MARTKQTARKSTGGPVSGIKRDMEAQVALVEEAMDALRDLKMIIDRTKKGHVALAAVMDRSPTAGDLDEVKERYRGRASNFGTNLHLITDEFDKMFPPARLTEQPWSSLKRGRTPAPGDENPMPPKLGRVATLE